MVRAGPALLSVTGTRDLPAGAAPAPGRPAARAATAPRGRWHCPGRGWEPCAWGWGHCPGQSCLPCPGAEAWELQDGGAGSGCRSLSHSTLAFLYISWDFPGCSLFPFPRSFHRAPLSRAGLCLLGPSHRGAVGSGGISLSLPFPRLDGDAHGGRPSTRGTWGSFLRACQWLVWPPSATYSKNCDRLASVPVLEFLRRTQKSAVFAVLLGSEAPGRERCVTWELPEPCRVPLPASPNSHPAP